MAENTRFKELSAEVKRNAEMNDAKFDDFHRQLQLMKESTEAKFDKINDAMALLLQRTPVPIPAANTASSPHGIPNSTLNMRGDFQVRPIKLDFPRFDGSNVIGWIFKAEQFFDYHKTPDQERLIIASVHLDHDIVPWFQMMQRNSQIPNWKAFTRALEQDFGPSLYDCPRASLFKLVQTGTVNEFYLEFTVLANRSQGLTTEAMLECFISGLQEDIRRDVRAMEPRHLAHLLGQ